MNLHKTTSHHFVTWNDKTLVLAPARLADYAALIRFLRRLSARTLYMRYFAPLASLSTERIQREIMRLFDGNRTTLVGRLAGETDIIVLVELAHLGKRGTGSVEIALTVHDAYQRQGIGRSIFALLPGILATMRVEQLQATMLVENTAMRKLLSASGCYAMQASGDTVSYQVTLQHQPHENHEYEFV
jgi:RimJ/RimL family protein N-acetyltransferase